jgi:hypothetical protein
MKAGSGRAALRSPDGRRSAPARGDQLLPPKQDPIPEGDRGKGGGTGIIELSRGADGFWRWTFGDSEGRQYLRSNRSYATSEEAVAAARQAYPGIPIEGPSERDPWWLRRIWLATVLTILTGGVGLFALLMVKAIRLSVRMAIKRTRKEIRSALREG